MNTSPATEARKLEVIVPTQPAIDAPSRKPKRSHTAFTTCYRCGTTDYRDYTQLIDLGNQGRELVDICENCFPDQDTARILYGQFCDEPFEPYAKWAWPDAEDGLILCCLMFILFCVMVILRAM